MVEELRFNAKFPYLDVAAISSDDISFPIDFKYGRENERLLKVFILSYLKLLSDSPLETFDSHKPIRVYKKFLNLLVYKPIKETIKSFSRLGDEILRNSYSSSDGLYIRPFVVGMKDTPIFKEYLEWQRTGSPEVCKFILSFLRFGKKLSYEDAELNTTAFREWKQVEERLDMLVLRDEDTASLRTIIKEIMGPLTIDGLFPKFGSGNVSERHVEDVYDKIEYLSTSPRLAYAFHRSRPSRGSDKGFGVPSMPIRQECSSSLTARLKFVPKDITKSRSICMEPNSFMYYQQEVHRWFRCCFDTGPIGDFVHLSDQTWNQSASLSGSKTHFQDTIDLSSASDSIHLDLVKKVFPSDWLFYMLATRSSNVELPDGTVYTMKKFAPMGSAICFPTQCVIFLAVCLYCYDAYIHGKTSGEWSSTPESVVQLLDALSRSRSGKDMHGKHIYSPLVYGDDIICDCNVTDDIISTLERLGFQVNVSKSFTNVQSFRESCGVYCYEGKDVTPVIFRLPLLKGGVDASEYASLVESINNFASNSFNGVSSFLLHYLRNYLGPRASLIPYVNDSDDFGILTRNKHPIDLSRLRYNKNYQIIEERVLVIGPRKIVRTKPTGLDEYNMDQWWRSRLGDYSPPSITRGSSIRPQETRVVPIWARCE